MRALTWIVAVVAALWSGYWFVGKSALERATDHAFASAAARGLVLEKSGYAIAGFPNRFDLTVTEPMLGDPKTGLLWQAPFLQIFSLSYKPWHVIAAFPDTQTLHSPGQDIAITSQKLQASVVVTPTPSLALDHTALVGSKLTASSTLGWTVTADELRFATQADPATANAHRIGFELLNLAPDPALPARLPDLPALVERLHLDATAGLSAPIDRFAGQARPKLTALTLREASLVWGTLKLFAKGDLAVVDGSLAGSIEIRVEGWRTLPKLIAALGLIKPEIAPTVENMLQAVASQGGDSEVLSLPLIFAEGRMNLGPLPLGPSPRID
jgi:hypothetical protein